MMLFSATTLISYGFLDLRYTFLAIIGMFASFCWCGRMTGALLNPTIVFAHLIKKQDRFTIKRALLYLIAQFSGALIGAFFTWQFIIQSPASPYKTINYDYNYILIQFAKQLAGSFFYTLVLFVFISADITFAQIDIQIWFALSISIVTICQITTAPFGVNPALVFSYQFWYCVYNDNYFSLRYVWTGICGPVIGGLLGSLFFQLVYRPVAKFYREQLMEDEIKLDQRIKQLQNRQLQFRRRTSILEPL